jgi:hypothetical protein
MSKENGIPVVPDAMTMPLRATEAATDEKMQDQAGMPSLIKVAIECNIDLALLRKQKRAVVELREGTTVTYEQETAAEGLLNLLDLVQDSILEQGLATEEDIFPRLPQLFDHEPSSLDAAA